MIDTARTSTLKAEATSRFLGRGGVVGVALGGQPGLTIFIQSADAPERQAVSNWAAANDVEVRFLVSGLFEGIVPPR